VVSLPALSASTPMAPIGSALRASLAHGGTSDATGSGRRGMTRSARPSPDSSPQPVEVRPVAAVPWLNAAYSW
jgi:hypothetical protein